MQSRRRLAGVLCVLSTASAACSCESGADAARPVAPTSAAMAPVEETNTTQPLDAGSPSSVVQRESREVLYLPGRSTAGQALPTIIWLHGYLASPNLGSTGQALADQLDVAILGVSATESLGGDRYRWSEDPKRDGARIREAITNQASRLNIDGKPALFGFSQGGKMAAEIAASEPDRYAGAWAIAPGGFAPPRFQPKGSLDGMFFRCSIGAGDPRGKVEWARSYCEQAMAAGADTETDIEPGFARHAFPPDFRETFIRWARRTLDASPR